MFVRCVVTGRTDVFKRHTDSHQNIKKKCEKCGEQISAGNLSRHQKLKKCCSKSVAVNAVDQQEVDNVHKIHTTIQLVSKDDGSILLFQNKIKFGDVYLALVPAFDQEKSDCNIISNAQNEMPNEIVIEPQLLPSLQSAGIELNEIVDIQKHEIEILVRLIPKADGVMDMVFNRIRVQDVSLDVTVATDGKQLHFHAHHYNFILKKIFSPFRK